MWRNAGDYVKRWGAALIRGAATNAEFTVIIVGPGDFSQRVVDQWNRLPTTTICAETINRFKNQMDPMLWQHGGLFISQRRLPAPVLQTRRNGRQIRNHLVAPLHTCPFFNIVILVEIWHAIHV